MNAVSIERATHPTDDVRELIALLDRTLAQQYLPEQRHGLALDDLFRPHVRFFIARVDGTAAGCAGVALFEAFAELKRMFVRESVRGRGVARALLARIESLYERAGFVACPPFGDYAAMAPAAVATSIFFEKRLAAPGAAAGGSPAGG